MSVPGMSTKAQNQGKDRGTGNIVTGETLENNRTALNVLDKSTVSQVATDTIDSIAGNIITAAAHSALKGDCIRMTSGAASGSEYRVFDTATNTITLEQDNLSPAPVGTDTFEILRPTSLTLSSDGTVTVTSGPLSFTRDSATQIVTEDTGTPANNRPLPVKLTDFSGDMILNASNLNLEVQTSHLGANPDSVRIGDGTETVNVNASNEMQVADDTARTSLGTIATDTTSIDGKTPSLGQAVSASSVPVVIASDQSNVPVSQATHDSLNLNANLQVGDADNTATNPVFTDRLTVVDLLDTPLLDATTLNGSGGALVDVVASLASAVKKVQLFSTAGVFLGLFDDTVLVAQFGPGSDDTVEVSIAASSVIALRSLEVAAPSGGSIVVNFLG